MLTGGHSNTAQRRPEWGMEEAGGEGGAPGHREKGEMSAHRQEQKPLWAGPWRASVDTHQACPSPAHPGDAARGAPVCEPGAADVAPSGRAHAPQADGGGIQHSGKCQGLAPSRGSWALLGVPPGGWQQAERERRGWLGDPGSLQHRATQNVGQVSILPELGVIIAGG